MIIAVSDVHLGCEGSHRDAFMDFLSLCDSTDVDHLVLLGDIMDFWRCNNAQVIVESSDVLERIEGLKAKKTHYVIGNHDYSLLCRSKRYEHSYQFPVCQSLRLSDDDARLFFTHGYELEVLANFEPLSVEAYEKFCERMCYTEDIFGEYASNLWNWIENRRESWWRYRAIKTGRRNPDYEDRIRRLALSGGKDVPLGIRPDEKLIFGHTHDPFVSQDNFVANTGSWVSGPRESPGIPKNTYIKIIDGKLELKTFDGKSPL